MKKILSLLLALVMLVGLCACGDKQEPDVPDTDPPQNTDQPNVNPDVDDVQNAAKAYPNCHEDGSIDLDKIAHFDPTYDYNQNERFKFAYIASGSGPLYQQAADAYEHWASQYNMEWAGFTTSNGDNDMFMTTLQTFIDNGVKGFVLDPDSTIFPTVKALLDQYPDVCWMSMMSPPRDGTSGDSIPIGGNMINNYVGFDNVDAGRQVANRLIQWKNDTYPDVPWEEVGFLMVDNSVSPPLHERLIGSKEAFLAAGGKEENFFSADCSATSMTMQGGLDAAGPVISTHPEIRYWLCNGLIDDMAQACASILEQQGLTETSAVCVFGGSALQMQWDAGQQDAFRFAIFAGQALYAEPIIGAVYAYLNGWATPDTIWPSWVKWNDHGADDHTYSQLRVPTVAIEYDNYKHFMEWVDLYASDNAYDYPTEGIALDDFSPFLEVPDDYKAP